MSDFKSSVDASSTYAKFRVLSRHPERDVVLEGDACTVGKAVMSSSMVRDIRWDHLSIVESGL